MTFQSTSVVCVNARYSQDASVFVNVEEFLEMCDHCFSSIPTLTKRDGNWFDEHGDLTLEGAD